jgi:hypothetical protein
VSKTGNIFQQLGGDMKILFLFFAGSLSAAAIAAEREICRFEVAIEVRPKQSEANWEVLPGKEKRLLSQAQIFLGHPKMLFLIKPEIDSQGVQTVEFPATNSEEVWSVCWYGDKKSVQLRVLVNAGNPTACRYKKTLVCTYEK